MDQSRVAAELSRACEPAYCAALGWYLEQGYSLYVLGDAEELRENDPEPVLAARTGYAEASSSRPPFTPPAATSASMATTTTCGRTTARCASTCTASSRG